MFLSSAIIVLTNQTNKFLEKRILKMREYFLTPEHENRKSYYKKAVVQVNEETGTKELYSYDTLVAYTTYNEAGELQLKIRGFYSATTLRHIKEFSIQEGFGAMNKKQLEEYLLN